MVLLVLALALNTGNIDWFHDSFSRGTSYLITLPVSLAMVGLNIHASVCQVRAWTRYPQSSHITPLVLPTIWCGYWNVAFLVSPLGDAGNPAGPVGFLPQLRQLGSLFGEVSLIFLMGWVVSVAVGVATNNCSRGHLRVWAVVQLLIFVWGGSRMSWGRGYEQNIYDWPQSTALLHSEHMPRTPSSRRPLPLRKSEPASTVQISCIVLGTDLGRMERQAYMMQKTKERLAAGDDIVLWSENAVGEFDVEAAAAELNQTSSERPSWAARQVVAPTFNLVEDRNFYNTVALLQAGSIKQVYNKVRPVPILESGITAGSVNPHYTEVNVGSSGTINPTPTILRIAMAICFDFNFPDRIRSAAGSNLVIGPSWYWSSIGYITWAYNVMRAVENGFTIFKCSMDGVSGAADPYGNILAFKPTVINDVFVAQVPVLPPVWTLYAHGGFLFGWLCVAGTVICTFLTRFPCAARQLLACSRQQLCRKHAAPMISQVDGELP